MKLRLLMWEECNRSCKGCCNKDWQLEKIPVCHDFTGFDEIMLTGGEPMLYPNDIHRTIRSIRKTNRDGEIYVYTAKLDNIGDAIGVLCAADGMCVTLHEQRDVLKFLGFANATQGIDRSLRVNVFKGVIMRIAPKGWDVKGEIEWIPNSPLPEGEVFMRLTAKEQG